MSLKKRVKNLIITVSIRLNGYHSEGKISIENQGSKLINCKIISHGTNNKLILPTGGMFDGCCFEFYGDDNRMEFGAGCHANNASFYIEDSNNAIVVGSNTNFAGKIHIACTEHRIISIGKNCLFSSEVVIRSGDSHSITDMDGNRINQAKDVIISDHVWVGHRVLINKGVLIAQNCIVGTGAVLTTKFEEENTIIAGVPAKIVKKNVNWDTKRI